MFSHGADSAHDAGGVGVSTTGATTVPARFVWPYGGKRVFVSGSFTRSVKFRISLSVTFVYTLVRPTYALPLAVRVCILNLTSITSSSSLPCA